MKGLKKIVFVWLFLGFAFLSPMDLLAAYCGDSTLDSGGECDDGSQTDTDGDCILDCFDNCPDDPGKTSGGLCGCGVVDSDSDGDGTADNCDGIGQPAEVCDRKDNDGDGENNEGFSIPQEDMTLANDKDGDGSIRVGEGCYFKPENPAYEQCISTGIAKCDGDGLKLVCDADSVLTEECQGCGNGVKELGEECDDGNLDNNDDCLDSCRKPDETFCGNSVVDEGEECDDGNREDRDGCNSSCAIESPAKQVNFCGNGTVETDKGEECDDGNTSGSDLCNDTCLNSFCGDGIVQNIIDEVCDDGNSVSGDGCNEICVVEYCGDGVVNNGEECDGETDCASSCSFAEPLATTTGEEGGETIYEEIQQSFTGSSCSLGKSQNSPLETLFLLSFLLLPLFLKYNPVRFLLLILMLMPAFWAPSVRAEEKCAVLGTAPGDVLDVIELGGEVYGMATEHKGQIWVGTHKVGGALYSLKPNWCVDKEDFNLANGMEYLDYNLSVETAMTFYKDPLLDKDVLLVSGLVYSDTALAEITGVEPTSVTPTNTLVPSATELKGFAVFDADFDKNFNVELDLDIVPDDLLCYVSSEFDWGADSVPAVDTTTGHVFWTSVAQSVGVGDTQQRDEGMLKVFDTSCNILAEASLPGWGYFAPMVFKKEYVLDFMNNHPDEPWVSKLDPSKLSDWLITGSGVTGVSGNKCFGEEIAGEGGHLSIRDPISLAEKFSFDTECEFDRSGFLLPMEDGGMSVVAGTQNGEIIRVNLSTGEPLWKTHLNARGFSALVSGYNNERIWVKTGTGENKENKNSLIALNVKDGSIVFHIHGLMNGETTPVVGRTPDGRTIIYTVNDNRVYPQVVAYDERTGIKLWSRELMDPATGNYHDFRQASPILYGNTLMIGTLNSDSEIKTTKVSTEDGATDTASSEEPKGALMAIATESVGYEPTSWCPKYRCTPENTGEPYLVSSLAASTDSNTGGGSGTDSGTEDTTITETKMVSQSCQLTRDGEANCSVLLIFLGWLLIIPSLIRNFYPQRRGRPGFFIGDQKACPGSQCY